ncbi:MAG: CRISPR-associated protein [Chlorobi bacterium]|nr:CRISPR-associated protein [Chlorobiota bacterium]
MFINLTNHPSSTWSEEQRREAEGLGGEIVDYPFPEVPPEASSEDVVSLAKEIFDDIMGRYGTEGLVVLVQGEFTLTVALVSLFTKAGVMTVCATTKRVVKENPDGSITRWFQFVQFREYKLP